MSVTVFRTLDRLPKRPRDVAVLRYMMDCDEATTAAAMGTTVEKVKSAAADARRRLGVQVLDVTATRTRRRMNDRVDPRPWEDASIPSGIDARRIYEIATTAGGRRRRHRRRLGSRGRLRCPRGRAGDRRLRRRPGRPEPNVDAGDDRDARIHPTDEVRAEAHRSPSRPLPPRPSLGAPPRATPRSYDRPRSMSPSPRFVPRPYRPGDRRRPPRRSRPRRPRRRQRSRPRRRPRRPRRPRLSRFPRRPPLGRR